MPGQTNLVYDQRSLALSRQIYKSTREGIIYYAVLHYEKDGHLEFVHSETGVRTLEIEFDKVADKECVSMNQFITLAVSEKVSTLMTINILMERAQKVDRNTLDELLKKVPVILF